MSPKTQSAIDNLVKAHSLPASYATQFMELVFPVAAAIARTAKKQGPFLLGVQGSQGSGKSTLSEFVSEVLTLEFRLKCEVGSIDDFYLSRNARQTLAETAHPLFATRGVPGTHDIDLLSSVFNEFKQQRPFTIPRFDKATDDLYTKGKWPLVDHTPDLFILEGWCVGIGPQAESELVKPINELEADEDPDGSWRRYVNEQLSSRYADIFDLLDSLLVIQAPSFDCVYQWRAQQEQKLIESLERKGQTTNKTMNTTQLQRFIQHYQRLTEHGLKTLPAKADYVLRLNTDHSFASMETHSIKADA